MDELRDARKVNLLALYEQLDGCRDNERDSLTRAISTIEKAIADDAALESKENELNKRAELEEKKAALEKAVASQKAQLERDIQASKVKQDKINNAIQIGTRVVEVGGATFLLANMLRFEAQGTFTSKLFNIIVKPIARIL